MRKLRSFWSKKNKIEDQPKDTSPYPVPPRPGSLGSPMQHATAFDILYNRLHNQHVNVRTESGHFRDLIINNVCLTDNKFYVNGVFVDCDESGNTIKTPATEWISEDNVYINVYW